MAEPGGPAGSSVAAGDGARRSRRSRNRRAVPLRWLRRAGQAAGLFTILAAPLAIGGVHRWSMILLFSSSALGLGLLVAGLAAAGRRLRVGAAVTLPFALLLVPLIQSIPVPLSLRARLDPNGTELLRQNDLLAPTAWPLSLDPPVTRVNAGAAAAALAAFLIAFHLSSSQSRRHLVMRVVAASGVAAVAIGLGHRILGLSKIYGLVAAPGRALF